MHAAFLALAEFITMYLPDADDPETLTRIGARLLEERASQGEVISPGEAETITALSREAPTP